MLLLFIFLADFASAALRSPSYLLLQLHDGENKRLHGALLQYIVASRLHSVLKRTIG